MARQKEPRGLSRCPPAVG